MTHKEDDVYERENISLIGYSDLAMFKYFSEDGYKGEGSALKDVQFRYDFYSKVSI